MRSALATLGQMAVAVLVAVVVAVVSLTAIAGCSGRPSRRRINCTR